MKKKKTIVISVLAVALAVIAIKPTLAWLSSVGVDKSQAIDISYFDISLVEPCDIRPAYTDEVNLVDYAAPGENMIYVETAPDVWEPGVLRVQNKSTIQTNIRVKIEYTYITGGIPAQAVYDNTPQTDFIVDFDVPSDWSYDAATECWNYLPGGGNIPPVDLVANPDGVTTALINSMGYSDQLEPGNVYEDETVTVTLKVEAKQAEYAAWTQVSP